MTNTPEGWKLVPVDPTQEMLSTAEREMRCIKVVRPDVEHIHTLYRAMLFTAPQPPASVAACAPALPASDQQITFAMMSEMQPLARMHNDWPGWPGSCVFAAAALRAIKRILLVAEPQPVKRLTDEQTNEIEDWFSNEFGLEAKHRTDFARAVEAACAAAWGVKLEEPT